MNTHTDPTDTEQLAEALCRWHEEPDGIEPFPCDGCQAQVSEAIVPWLRDHDTEVAAQARREAWDEGWRAGADDQKVWSGTWDGTEPGFVGTGGVNPYRADTPHA